MKLPTANDNSHIIHSQVMLVLPNMSHDFQY
jgi:hypothetical protein